MIMSIYVLEVTTGQTQTPKQFIMPVVEKLIDRKIKKRILILKKNMGTRYKD